MCRLTAERRLFCGEKTSQMANFGPYQIIVGGGLANVQPTRDQTSFVVHPAKVISLKLFLDMVPSLSAYVTLAMRGCFRGGFVHVSLRFKAKENFQRSGDAFFYINIKEAKELGIF